MLPLDLILSHTNINVAETPPNSLGFNKMIQIPPKSKRKSPILEEFNKINQIPPKSNRKSPRLRSVSSPSSSTSEDLNFPIDLLIEILKRIPLKPLIKLTCVCKSWYFLITSPSFISVHTHFNSGHKNLIMNQKHLFREILNVQSHSLSTKFTVANMQALTIFNPIFPVNYVCPVGKKHFVVCCYDGLVCMFDFYSRDPRNAPLVLWNPSIRKACSLPPPLGGDFELTCGGFPRLIFGAGFDSASNDYVVVRIAYFSGECGCTVLRGSVYGLNLEEWKSLEEGSVLCSFSSIRWRGVFLNGVIHWVGNLNVSLNEDDGVCRAILTLKLGSGVFGVMNLPKEVVGVMNQTVRVVSVPNGGKGLLGVVQCVGNGLRLWVMKEYGLVDSWVQLLSVNLGNMLSNDMNVAVLSSKAVVVRAKSLNVWMVYDHDSEDGSSQFSLPFNLDYVDRYVESLVLCGHRTGILPGRHIRQRGVNGSGTSSRGRSRRGRKRRA